MSIAVNDEVRIELNGAVRKGEIGKVVRVVHGWGGKAVHVRLYSGPIETLPISGVRKTSEGASSLGW